MDTPKGIPLTERVANSIEQLSSAALDLNFVSGELGQAIAAIDTVLQSLNVGVPTWARIAGAEAGPRDENYWHRDLGYAKVGNRWGIALRDVSGNYNFPDEEDCDTWLFNDAPRWLRIEGVEKIPNLLDELIKSAHDATNKIRSKTVEANQLAAAIAQAAGKKTESIYSSLGSIGEAGKKASPGATSIGILAKAAKRAAQGDK